MRARRLALLVLLASSTLALATFWVLTDRTDALSPAESGAAGAGASWAAAPLVALAIVGGSGALVATLVAKPGR